MKNLPTKITKISLLDALTSIEHSIKCEINEQGIVIFHDDVSHIDFTSKYLFVELPDENLPAFNISPLTGAPDVFQLSLPIPVSRIHVLDEYAPELKALKDFVTIQAKPAIKPKF